MTNGILKLIGLKGMEELLNSPKQLITGKTQQKEKISKITLIIFVIYIINYSYVQILILLKFELDKFLIP